MGDRLLVPVTCEDRTMLAAIVTAAVVSTSPSTYDLLSAHADLHMPYGSPPLTERSPRMRLAMLVAMVAADALDRDAPDHRWFSPTLAWGTELDFARTLVARVRECPTLAEDWLPPAEWLRAEAAAFETCAAAWRRRAAEYRERSEWEGHQADELATWASWLDGQAGRYSAAGWQMAGFAGGSWSRPRRVVLQEARELIGEVGWQKREWPGAASN